MVILFGNPKAERKAIESTYTDVCDIVRNVEKEIDFINRHIDEVIYKNIPCALSMNKNTINSTDTAAFFNYSAVIFISPEIDIRPSDKIIVTRYGRTIEYTNAGRPVVYATHQEVSVIESGAVGDDDNTYKN